MATRRDGMTIANINSFLEMSGADGEAGEIVNAAGIKISDPVQEPGYGRTVDVVKLREDLLLKLQNERSAEVDGLRAKQKQIMSDKKGREAELLELQKAEESHRELLLKDRDERNKIAQDLHCLRRSHLVDMEEETRRELASLQRERELLQEKEKNNEAAIDEVRRQIMEQDEVYHHAMDAARSKIKTGKNGVDQDGRPMADTARSQRQAIQSEQARHLLKKEDLWSLQDGVATAEVYGKRAGTLQEEQTRLQHEIQNVDERIQKARKNGIAPAKGAEDALAALMTEAGMEEQATRLRRLKGDFEKQHAEDISGAFIKDYEGAEAKTRKALKNSAKLLEGRTGEYAEAAADAFLDDWLKTDADRARDAAAAAAAAAGGRMLSPHDNIPPIDRTIGAASTGADATGQGGEGRRLSATRNGSTAHEGQKKKRRSSHDRGRGNGHYTRRRSSGGRKIHMKGRTSRDSAGTSSAGSSDSEGGRPNDHVAGHGGSEGKHNDGNQQRRRNAAVGPISSPNGIAPVAPADSQPSAAEHHHHHNRAGKYRAPNGPPAGEHRREKSGEGGSDAGPAAQQPESISLGQVGREDEEQESSRRAKDDSAQLRATVERLERELSSVKAGTRMGAGGVMGAQGEGFGLAGGSGGTRWGPPADPTAGAPWMAGGMAAPGLQQYLASLDAENARMMNEIQGLSSGGAGGGGQQFGLTGLGGDANMGLSTMFPGAAGATAGKGMAATGYLGPGLHVKGRGPLVDGSGEQGEGGGVSAITAARKRSRVNGDKERVGPEWDEELSGASGEPLSPRNKEYHRKMIEMDAEHKEAVKRLEFEMQRLELEQQLEDMRERMAREKKTRQQDVAHEQWVTEQKRNLQAIKIQKALAKERQLIEVQQTLTDARGGGACNSALGGGRLAAGGFGEVAAALHVAGGWRPGVGGIVQRPYNKDQGFCVFWDYLTGLPKRSGSKVIGKVRLAFGLYIGKRLHGKMLSTPWTDIAPHTIKNGNTGKAETFSKLETRSTFPGIPVHLQTKLVVELQFKDEAGVQRKGEKGNLGWGCVYVFKPEKGSPHRLTLRAGLTRLTLFPGSVDLRIANVNDDKSAVSRSTPTAAFVRLVHGMDMNPAAAFVVDPDTQHLYAAYGRGNISQMERQKLMAGTFLRAILALGKFKRALVTRKRTRASGGDAPKDHPPLRRGSSGPLRRGSTRHVKRTSFKLPRTGTFSSETRSEPQAADGADGTDTGDGEGAHQSKADKQQAPKPDEKQPESPKSEERDSVEEEDSEEDSGSVKGGGSETRERRRSSLSSIQSQLAGQKTMARRASLSKRRQSTVSRQPFLKGDGFDIYIDRACGMPYSCTISKVVVRVIGNVGNEGHCSAISDGESPSNNPVFRLRQEYRTGPESRMDMTSTVMIRVDTLDRFFSEHRAVGYALLAIFMDPSGNQPTNASADGAFLREGNYQVPIYQKPPPDMRRVTSRSLDRCLRVPCASVLVRVKPASKSSAGKTLSRADVPEDEWKHFGLAPPIPQFAPGVYDNSDLQLTDLERQMLDLRSKDTYEETVKEAVKLINSPDNPAPGSDSDSDDDTLEEWAESMMAKKPTKMVEYHRSEKYRPDEGFSVVVAGLTNMKPPGAFKSARLFKVIYSLLMPGLFYMEDPPASDQAEFTHTYDPRSPQLAPRFKDPPHAFRNQPINSNQFIILDVRFLKVDVKGNAAVPEEPCVAPGSGAWGLLPAFPSGEVAIGSFIVPLLSGPVPVEILKAENPLKMMTEKVKAKHPGFRVLEGSSVVVQICNALLENVLPAATQDPALNFIGVKRVADALGVQQEKYVFDHIADAGHKSVGRLVPKSFKGGIEDFFTSTNVRFATATGIPFVARPGELPKGRS
ncbi:unnamed protein product [Ectocarpus sp. 4 AP-2014]